MKTPLLPFLLAITASLAAATSQAASVGTLRFSGVINGGTCDLAAGDVSRNIPLPEVKISDFDSAVFAGETEFSISADCDSDIRNVIFEFAGTPASGTGLLYSNTGTSAGTALWLRSGATLPANGTPAERSRTVATSGKKAVLPLKAAYHKSSGAITKGTLASAVTVSITYN